MTDTARMHDPHPTEARPDAPAQEPVVPDEEGGPALASVHGAGHGHEAGEDPGEPLGEVDVRAWAAALLGGGVALLVVLSLFVASGT